MNKQHDFEIRVCEWSELKEIGISHPSELDENDLLNFHCPQCGNVFATFLKDFGRVVTCPKCKATTPILLSEA